MLAQITRRSQGTWSMPQCKEVLSPQEFQTQLRVVWSAAYILLGWRLGTCWIQEQGISGELQRELGAPGAECPRERVRPALGMGRCVEPERSLCPYLKTAGSPLLLVCWFGSCALVPLCIMGRKVGGEESKQLC